MADFPFVVKWSKDNAFCEANGWRKDLDRETLYRWWKHHVTADSEDLIRLGIEKNGLLIGYVDLAKITNHGAELGIAIGESERWGQGIGTHALKLFMEYAAEKYKITSFTAEIQRTNIRAKKLLEKIGFKEIICHASNKPSQDAYQQIRYIYHRS